MIHSINNPLYKLLNKWPSQKLIIAFKFTWLVTCGNPAMNVFLSILIVTFIALYIKYDGILKFSLSGWNWTAVTYNGFFCVSGFDLALLRAEDLLQCVSNGSGLWDKHSSTNISYILVCRCMAFTYIDRQAHRLVRSWHVWSLNRIFIPYIHWM